MLGVCYYPEHWPESLWGSDAKRMRGIGITYVRTAEFAWSRLEPRPNCMTFDWLDRAIETLGQAGLRVVLGTPTAAPSKWLIDWYPEILPVDQSGRRFGGRRYYDFSSEVYWQQNARTVVTMAERYSNNSHVVSWQIANEFGCHDTVVSDSEAAQIGFQR